MTMKSLVLAEKPSVGHELARVLGCKKRAEGYIEGDKYIVTRSLGHLITLARSVKTCYTQFVALVRFALAEATWLLRRAFLVPCGRFWWLLRFGELFFKAAHFEKFSFKAGISKV